MADTPDGDGNGEGLTRRRTTEAAIAIPQMKRQECWNRELKNGAIDEDEEEEGSGFATLPEPPTLKSTWERSMDRHVGDKDDLLASFAARDGEGSFMLQSSTKGKETQAQRDARLNALAFVVAGKAANPRLAAEMAMEEAMKEDEGS